MASGGNVSIEDRETKRDYYFDSYADPAIHKTMLQDRVRTESYRDAMIENPHLFRRKVVLDVGSGTGILSMFAAKAGASKVIGVECSAIIEFSKDIIKDNGYEKVITLIRGKIEEVELPEGIDKVDIIVSEWMGHSLFYESMLDSVLFARDKWLKPSGLLFPDKVRLFLSGIEAIRLRTFRIDFWNNVWGNDMDVFKRVAIRQPLTNHVDSEQVVTNRTQLVELDLCKMKKEEANFSTPFSLMVTKDDYLNAFCTFFEVEFSKTFKKVKFCTAPDEVSTHWKQSVFFTDEVIPVKVGEMIQGHFDLRQNSRHKRNLDIKIKVDFDGSISEMHENNLYKMR